ncbi:MAG: 2-dehydropantoate 2-reductase [Propioniciclava sp.]|uniref:ketopantoate reductase family protein n=1 Tax=Propioniciclava sp. TaxID=2038686 RepID=UPI0039E3D0F7
MRFLFLGAGAIGTYIGGSLVIAGHDVSFVEQPATATAIAQQGLTIETSSARQVVRGFGMHTDPAEALDAGPYDVCVFALKSFDTVSVLEDWQSLGRPLPTILSVQNGVDNEPAIAARLGADRVIAGTVATAIAKPGLGHVVEETHRGIGIALGNSLSEEVITALNDAGLGARGYADAGSMKWSKLLTNLQGSATSAILDMPVGEVFADRRLHALETEAMRECVRVMRALGHRPVDLPGTPVRALAFAVEHLPRTLTQPIFVRLLGGSRGDKMPSLHIDLHAGRRRSEVGFLHGAVVRHGATVGVPTPVNALLTDTLEALTDGREDIATFRHHPEALLLRLR